MRGLKHFEILFKSVLVKVPCVHLQIVNDARVELQFLEGGPLLVHHRHQERQLSDVPHELHQERAPRAGQELATIRKLLDDANEEVHVLVELAQSTFIDLLQHLLDEEHFVGDEVAKEALQFGEVSVSLCQLIEQSVQLGLDAVLLGIFRKLLLAALNELEAVGKLGCLQDLSVTCVRITVFDIVLDGLVEEHRLLHDDGKLVTNEAHRVAFNFSTVYENLA